MKAKRKTVSVICAVLALILLASLLLAAFGSGLAVSQSDINDLQNKQNNIAKQKQQITDEIGNLEEEKGSVIEQKAVLDEKNDLARQEIEIIDEQIVLYEDMIEKKKQELEKAIEVEEEQKEALRVRMRKMEETGSYSYISVLFKATSFTDLLSRLDSVSSVMNRDKNLEEEYIAAREYVEEVKAEYEATLADYEEKKAELENKKAKLEKDIASATATIVALEEDIENNRAAYEENERLEQAIDAEVKSLLAQMEKERQEQQQNGGSGGGSGGQGIYSDGPIITGSGSYKWPTPGYTNITSRYGYRIHPIFHTSKLHTGVDVGAPSGASIYAADGGTVAIAVYSSSYGNYVLINHNNGTSTLYAHMTSMAVSQGQNVEQGAVIGYVGSTGNSTGPHLHFEVRVNGSTTNPMSYSYF